MEYKIHAELLQVRKLSFWEGLLSFGRSQYVSVWDFKDKIYKIKTMVRGGMWTASILENRLGLKPFAISSIDGRWERI